MLDARFCILSSEFCILPLRLSLLIQPRNSLLHILKANIGVHVSCRTTVFSGNSIKAIPFFDKHIGPDAARVTYAAVVNRLFDAKEQFFPNLRRPADH